MYNQIHTPRRNRRAALVSLGDLAGQPSGGVLLGVRQ